MTVEATETNVAESIAEEQCERRAATIRGLRELADFLEAHPVVPLPYVGSINAFVQSRDEMATIARAASWRKQWREDWFTLTREFSVDVNLEVNIERATVCRKVITGTRIQPAQPEQTVETFEWVCDDPSLLAPMSGATER